MPQAVTYFLAFAASSAGIAVGSGLLIAAGYALTFGALYVYSDYQRRKAQRRGRDAFNDSLRDRLVMTALADGPRSRVYGVARNVDGVLFKGTWGADKRYYTLVVAVAGHEVDAIEDVYFNDSLVTLDMDGYVQTEPWSIYSNESKYAEVTLTSGVGSVVLPYTPVAGSVSVVVVGSNLDDLGLPITRSVPFTITGGTTINVNDPQAFNGTAQVNYQAAIGRSYARVRKYLGAPTQDISALLTPNFPEVTSNDKFRGIALLLVDLEYSQDAFPTGVPQISAVVRGAKILDTRTSTTAWSQNPAMIARDWSMYAYGGNCSAAQIDEAAVIVAANACDVDSTFTTGASSVVMDTYQCGIVCRLDAQPDQFLDEIVESMAGRWGWAGGKLRMVAGAYRAPVATITEDWCTDAGDIQITPAPPRSELVNSYRVTIASRDDGYVPQQMPALRPSAYITEDGQELTREIDMQGVTKREHALHIAGVLLRDARQSLTVELPCNMRAFQLELFDVVSVTLPRFGWTAKTFEVIGWRFSLAGGVVLVLKEITASIYTLDAAFEAVGSSDNTSIPLPWEVSPVTGLVVTTSVSSLNDGQPIVRALVQWDLHPDIGVLQSGWIEIQYLQLGMQDVPISWVNETPIGVTWENAASQPVGWNSEQQATPDSNTWQVERVRGNQVSALIPGLRANGLYLFRIRAENTIGARSDWGVQVLIESGSSPLPVTVEAFVAFDAAGVGFSSMV